MVPRVNDAAFQGELLGQAKIEAEHAGRKLRTAFDQIARQLDAWQQNGITLDPWRVTFSEPADQAAWETYCYHRFGRHNSGDPPAMEHETTIERHVRLEVHPGGR